MLVNIEQIRYRVLTATNLQQLLQIICKVFCKSNR